MPLSGSHHIASYGGQQVLAVDYLVLPGAAPSVAVLTMIPGATDVIPKIGNLVLSDGSNTLTYYDCAIDVHRLEVVKDSRGASVWYVGVLDRRWKWRHQYISGVYNKRLPNGEFDIMYTDDRSPLQSPPPQKKSLKQLCQMLLEKMQESSYDVSDLPDDIYPYVDWDFANPAVELEQLCTAYGRMLVLGQDNLVHIVEKGGTGTIEEGEPTSQDHYWTLGTRPQKLMLVGGQTVVEAGYWLMPVGYEQDMSVKPQDYLSYMPPGGWQWADAFNLQCIIDGKDRSVAYASVYRTFRPWAIAGAYGAAALSWIGVEGPNRDTAMANIDQILPLRDHLCAAELWANYHSSYSGNYGEDRHLRTHKPYVKWADVRPLSLSSGQVNYYDYSAFFIPDCEVDPATGEVTFAVPITLQQPAPNQKLILLCAHHVRDRINGQVLRFTKTVNVPGGVYGTKIIRDDSVVRTVIYDYSPDVYSRGPLVQIVTNEDDVQERADQILEEALREYAEHEQDVELIGFVPILPESHVQHVHYQMRWNDAAFTTVRYTVAVTGD